MMEVVVTAGARRRAKLFTCQMPFLLPNQQCQGTETSRANSHEWPFNNVTVQVTYVCVCRPTHNICNSNIEKGTKTLRTGCSIDW